MELNDIAFKYNAKGKIVPETEVLEPRAAFHQKISAMSGKGGICQLRWQTFRRLSRVHPLSKSHPALHMLGVAILCRRAQWPKNWSTMAVVLKLEWRIVKDEAKYEQTFQPRPWSVINDHQITLLEKKVYRRRRPSFFSMAEGAPKL